MSPARAQTRRRTSPNTNDPSARAILTTPARPQADASAIRCTLTTRTGRSSPPALAEVATGLASSGQRRWARIAMTAPLEERDQPAGTQHLATPPLAATPSVTRFDNLPGHWENWSPAAPSLAVLSVPAANEWQGRAVQPDTARGITARHRSRATPDHGGATRPAHLGRRNRPPRRVRSRRARSELLVYDSVS